MSKQNFWKELKRRNVYRVAITYAVVAWLIIQVASILLPTFKAPAWVMKVLTLVVIFGFPIALVLAWAFEMSPEGMVRSTAAQDSPEQAIGEKRKPVISNIIIGVLIVLIMGQFLYNRYGSAGNIKEISIAVLPLVNLNSLSENLEYFSDGVTNEIIDELAKINQFQITPFTTGLLYKKSAKSHAEIAVELDVDLILTGTSRIFNNGDSVRLSIELIEPAAKKRIWNSTYNEVMRDAPFIQMKIARKISENLNLELTQGEKEALEDVNTEEGEAFRLFLHAKAETAKLNGDGFRKSIEFLNQALAIDPEYAQAHVLLAWTYTLASYSFFQENLNIPYEKTRSLVTSHLQKAFSLNPKSSDAYLVRANYNLYVEGKINDAVQDVEYAIELNSWPRIPTNYCICTAVAAHLVKGNLDRAKEVAEIGQQVDPGNVFLLYDYGSILLFEGKIEEAQKIFSQTSDMLNIPAFIYWEGVSYFQNDQYTEALQFFEEAYSKDSLPTGNIVAYLANTNRILDDITKSEKLEEELLSRMSLGEHNLNIALAMIEIGKNNTKEAVVYLQKAFENTESSLAYFINIDPIFKAISEEPEFIEIRKKMQYYE